MKIIIHLGYPKAWSKFIQKFLFKGSSLNYLDVTKANFYSDYLELRDFMNFSTDDEFNNKIKHYRSKINKFLKDDEINLYSDEFFLCPNNSGFKMIFRIIKFFSYNNNDLDFVIFTRKQCDLINSYYCQNIEEFEYLNPLYNDYLHLVEFFKGREPSRIEKNFFKIWNFNKIEKLIFKLNKKKPYIIKCENLLRKNENTLTELSKIFNIPKDKIMSIFNNKKVHSTVKNQNMMMVKSTSRIVINYPFTRIFLRYLSMDFKLFIKSFIEKFSNKKFITTTEEFNNIINEYYNQ